MHMVETDQVQRVVLRKVYDSRGNPTVEAEITTRGGKVGRASSPSGASRGTHEVVPFPKEGVDAGIERTRERLVPRITGAALGGQSIFDATLHEVDGTEDFSVLGGNTATALSVAYAAATAAARDEPLWRAITDDPDVLPSPPALVGNVMNGGVHAVGGPAIQEFIAFVEAPTARAEVEAAVAVHREVGRRLRELLPKTALGKGDEGGWVAPLPDEQALEILAGACRTVGEERADRKVRVRPGLDLAASELLRDGHYHYRDRKITPDEQGEFVARLATTYDLAYIEDPLDQEDFERFAELTRRVGKGRLIVGDDLYTTSVGRLQQGIDRSASNAILIKVNQVGTLTDTLEASRLARRSGWATVTSHRSGETPDGWLAHVALALGSRGLKCGVLGGERIAKLNELVRIAGDA